MVSELNVVPEKTLRTAIDCRGIGLHTGRKISLRLCPAPAGTGIVFRRTDAGVDLAARVASTVESSLCTSLSNGEGVVVGTIEHLMAALAGAEIDNVIVELDGPEVPVMDGSSAPFVFLLECAGSVEQDEPRRAIKVLKTVRVESGGKSATLRPDHGFSMSFEIDYENTVIRHQDMALVFEPGTFKSELSRARTFGLLADVDRMRAAGLALGGSLANAVVVSGDRVLNAEGLRYADEFVRHKLLDAFGDLYLAGAPILGHFHGVRSGHAETRRLVQALLADPSAWRYTTVARGAFSGRDWQDTARLARA